MTYETTVRAYKNIPFQFRLKKNGYYDISGSLIGGYIAYNLEFQPYTGLNMSYYQGTDSLMTVTADSGDSPDGSLLTGTFGCLAEVGGGTGSYINYTKVGTPSVNVATGDVSGFSTSNYLKLPEVFNPGSSTWEIKMKIKTGSATSGTYQQFFHSCTGTGESGRFGIGVDINNDGRFNMFLSSDGNSWLFSEYTGFYPSANTIYWIRFGWTGTEYYFDYSTDDTTYTRGVTYSSTSPVCSMVNSYIGVYSTASFDRPWPGTIYLADCQITIDNSVWWSPLSGTDYIVKKQGYVNYTTAGTPTIDINTGEVSGFSTSNYIYKDFGLSSADSWEINTAFMVTSNTSSNRNILCSMAGTSGYYAGVSFNITSNNYLDMQLGLTTSSYDNITGSFVITPNTKYYLKGTFDGSTYEFKYSTDGETYTSIGTISSTAKIYQSVVTRLGIYGNANIEPLTNGTIYLADTNISVNGSEYWNPLSAYNTTAQGLLPTGVTDDGSAQTWNLFYNSGTYRLNTTSTMTGYTWAGSVAIPSHTV